VSSLNSFKQKLRGEKPLKKKPDLSDWLNLVIEPIQQEDILTIEELEYYEIAEAELDDYAENIIQLDSKKRNSI
jgi:hypothetical protein